MLPVGVDAIGRRDEIDRIARVLTAVAAGAPSGAPGQVVELSGDAGVGKSTVVAATLARALADGWQILRATPTAAEAAFPWTALAQLMQGVRRELIDASAAGYLANVDAAVSGARSGPIEPELVAFGLAGVLDALCSQAAPALVVVDDYHWLDPASAGALAYSLRGLNRRRCAVLLARRNGEPVPFEPGRLVAAEQLTEITIGGLSLASLREIVAQATGATFGRAELAQLHQRTGGNPLYAVELARMVLDGVPLDAAALPESLRATMGKLVASLQADTRRALGAAALSVRPDLDLLQRALPGIDVLAALAPAEEADVVRIQYAIGASRPVVFRHPLLANAAVDSLTADERRRLHAALAAAVDDPVERAAHLATDVRPDDELAAVLADAVADASARGAVDTAVDLARAAVDATPTGAAPLVRAERCLRHTELAAHAGRFGELATLLVELRAALAALPDDTSCPAQTDVVERATWIETTAIAMTQGSQAGALAAQRALATVTTPQVRLQLQTLIFRTTQHVDAARAAALAEQMFGEHTEHTGLDALFGAALLAMARVAVGDPVDVDDLVARAESPVLDDDTRERYLTMLTEIHVWTDHPRTEAISNACIHRMERSGHRLNHLNELMYLGQHLFVRGQFARAEAILLRLEDYRAELGDQRQPRGDLALLLAAQGNADAATRVIAEALATPNARMPTDDLWVASAAGSVAHTLGRPDAADALLDAEQLAYDLGIHAVRGLRIRRDLVEALVAANRLGDAAAALTRLERDAERGRVPTARADAAAAAGVVAAADGDFDRAQAHFDRAIEIQREYDVRYELARTLLAAGSAARRAGSRTLARDRLDAATSLFEAMGAASWSQRCAHELERIPGRRRTASGELTPTERQVAELVAAGHTNAEIAAALFVSLSTVESNLTRTYRKLGVRSRTELARHLNTAT